MKITFSTVILLALLMGCASTPPGKLVLEAEAGYAVAVNAWAAGIEQGLVTKEVDQSLETRRIQARTYLNKARVALRGDMEADANSYAEFALNLILEIIMEVPTNESEH